jgi:ABC-2 type transport system ATP-binding protein
MKIDVGDWRVAGNAGAIAGEGMARPLAIEARGLVKRFDGFTAVDGVDLSVPEGAIYGILGPNGAGKTTTLRMLLGIIDPDAGLRCVLGHDRPHDVAHAIGYLPEERGLYPSMKAFEAIAFVGAAPCSRKTVSAMPPTGRSASFPRAWRSRCNCWARWSTNRAW